MWKPLAAAILLLALMISTFSGAAIVVDYYTNTGVYSKNCENKARPQMHCNGKCQMMKKLEQQEKQEQQNDERKTGNKNEVISSKSFFAIPFFKKSSGNSFFTIIVISKPVDKAYSLFRPPQTV